MKCNALLACDKVIIDKDGAHSLINVTLNASIWAEEAVVGQAPRIIPIPPDAIAPQMWFIYTLWQPAPEDVGQSFEQVYQIYRPKGGKVLESRLSFTQKDDHLNQTTFMVRGLPVGEEGKLKIVTWLDRDGRRVSDMIDTFILIAHGKASSSPSALVGSGI